MTQKFEKKKKKKKKHCMWDHELGAKL